MRGLNRLVLAGVALAVCFIMARPARAEIILDIYNDGSGNVIAAANGSLDLTDLTFEDNNTLNKFVWASATIMSSGGAEAIYGGSISGPSSWGAGGFEAPNSASGDPLLVGDQIGVPLGYASGASLSAEDIFNGNTIDAMGLTPGTYTYNWGTGPDADSIVVNISETAPISSSPEPATGLLAMAVVGAGLFFRRLHAKSAN